MKVIGSRGKGSHDEFSDYDYEVESEGDLPAVRSAVENCLLWRLQVRGNFTILTGVDRQGKLFDYSGPSSLDWPKDSRSGEAALVADYWLTSFRHLKALYRRQMLLLDVGLDFSCGLARDLVVWRHAKTTDYKNFYVYKSLAIENAPDLSGLFEVTGMPARTMQERVSKMQALNTFVDRISHGTLPSAHRIWQERFALISM